MDRRAFLSILAGSPLIFGLRELLAQDAGKPADAKAVPEWYQAALKRMMETHRCGIVLVVPEDEKERARIGRALVDLYNAPIQAEFEICYSVVVICLTSAMVESCLGGDLKKSNRILLDAEGKRVIADRIEMDVLESQSKFESSFRAFAYGLGDERLAEQAKAIEKGLSGDVKKAGEELFLGHPETIAPARVLSPKADSILPWILHMHHLGEAGAKRKPEKAPNHLFGSKFFLFSYMVSQNSSKSDLTLPFGVRLAEREREKWELDGCPGCGMSAMPPGRRLRFVSFYEK